jgi:hypothetical protein
MGRGRVIAVAVLSAVGWLGVGTASAVVKKHGMHHAVVHAAVAHAAGARRHAALRTGMRVRGHAGVIAVHGRHLHRYSGERAAFCRTPQQAM